MKTWKKLIQLVGILVGVAIIMAGIGLMNSAPSPASIATEYALDDSFGADFYTEMYGVTYDILSQLQNISRGLTSNFGHLLDAIYEVVSTLIIVLGAITTTAFGYLFLSDFAKTEKKDTQSNQVIQVRPTDVATTTVEEIATEATEKAPDETNTTIEA